MNPETNLVVLLLKFLKCDTEAWIYSVALANGTYTIELHPQLESAVNELAKTNIYSNNFHQPAPRSDVNFFEAVTVKYNLRALKHDELLINKNVNIQQLN
jgi:hypothetical protein